MSNKSKKQYRAMPKQATEENHFLLFLLAELSRINVICQGAFEVGSYPEKIEVEKIGLVAVLNQLSIETREIYNLLSEFVDERRTQRIKRSK